MKHPTRDDSDTPTPTSAGPANSTDEALRLSLATLHGPLLGPVLAEAAKKMRAEAVARLWEQNARLTARAQSNPTGSRSCAPRLRCERLAISARRRWQRYAVAFSDALGNGDLQVARVRTPHTVRPSTAE
jgi:hypothetical protein